MSHRHFCDYAGHEWECTGTALRPLTGDMEPSICMCPMHQVPLADGDHSECPVELIACSEHRDEQFRDMGALDTSDLAGSQVDAENTMFKDNDGNPNSMEEAKAHNADDSMACPVFQELKDKDCASLSLCITCLKTPGCRNESPKEATRKRSRSKKPNNAMT